MSKTGRDTAAFTARPWTRRCEPAKFWARWLVLVSCLLWLSPTVMAQTLSQTELQKLVASNPRQGALFGDSVAISGDRALIGASWHNNSGTHSGAAYVYERDETGMWVQVTPKLTASDGVDGDSFGNSVALSGDRALVGAFRDDVAGSAYVYERDGAGAWIEVAKFSPSDTAASDFFGSSVALSGDWALVGAYRADDYTGSVYVYERDGAGAWAEVAKLNASDAAASDYFGYSVALSGDRALVGAFRDVEGGRRSGSAYVYERDVTGTWVEVAKLNASDAARGDEFGASVSLSGDRALIGASGGADASSGSGSAYVFERDGTGLWPQVAKLTASDATATDFFGNSVSISGDRALVGAESDADAGNNSGSAYVYERDRTGAWVELTKLTASDAAAEDFFGNSVALSGGQALVGAWGDEDDDKTFIFNALNAGSAYMFDVTALGDEDKDEDEDGIIDSTDNCPADWNPLQENFDEDLLGDMCDQDDDNDGVDDTDDAFPLDPDRTLSPMILGSVDSEQYGFRFEGIDSHRESLERQFDASGADLLLTLTGFDIDTGQEVRVLVNDTQIGFLSRTPDNGRGASQLTIVQSLLNSTGNTLRFEQASPGWIWGVTDLLLNEIGALPQMTLGSVDSVKYGFRFEGINTHREALERQFDASGSDLLLTLTGYDIDIAAEVRVLVNGTQIGFLSRTPDNGRRTSQLTIEQSLLNSTGNTLRFEQTNPGWRWGVTDLVLSEGGM